LGASVNKNIKTIFDISPIAVRNPGNLQLRADGFCWREKPIPALLFKSTMKTFSGTLDS